MTDKKSKLLCMLEDRFVEMVSSNATICVFTHKEIAAMLEGARELRVQLDNALDNALVVRNEITRLRGLFSTASKERDDMKRTADSSAEYLRQVEDVLITVRNERDAAVQANERKERELVELQARVRQLESQRNDARNDLIAAQGFCDKLRGDLKALSGQRDNLQRQLDEHKQAINSLRKDRDDALRQGSNNCIERDNWKRRCEDHRTAYRDLKALAEWQTTQLHEAKQTETALRNENSDLHNRVKALSLKPMQYGAGGASSGCNNSIDAAKAQQSPLQELCRDRLHQTIKDGTWTQYPELRQYVAEIAINGEPNQ